MVHLGKEGSSKPGLTVDVIANPVLLEERPQMPGNQGACPIACLDWRARWQILSGEADTAKTSQMCFRAIGAVLNIFYSFLSPVEQIHTDCTYSKTNKLQNAYNVF